MKNFNAASFASAVIRQPAPHFEGGAWTKDGVKPVKLTDFKGKYVVLFFYPLDFTFVCPTEIIEYGNKAAEFRKIGCEVVGASVDSVFSHMAWSQQPREKGGLGQLDIPIIGDITKQISKDYGVLIEQGEGSGVSLRGTFIIDKDGVLRHSTINDLPVGRNVDETLRLV